MATMEEDSWWPTSDSLSKALTTALFYLLCLLVYELFSSDIFLPEKPENEERRDIHDTVGQPAPMVMFGVIPRGDCFAFS